MASGDTKCVFVFCQFLNFFWHPEKTERVSLHIQQTNGTLLNYIDQPDSFADTASTALLAASTFHFATITGDNTYTPAAILAMELVQKSVDENGWLCGTVDPLTFSTPSPPGVHSPEGQSFVLLLEAAVSFWRPPGAEKRAYEC
jgi:hypothetical protein